MIYKPGAQRGSWATDISIFKTMDLDELTLGKGDSAGSHLQGNNDWNTADFSSETLWSPERNEKTLS